jgi:RNA polymerase sigma-70 factor (ECF subfamily)
MKLFENICAAHGEKLQKFIYSRTRSDAFAAEEIYQNTMLGALKGLHRLRDSEKMKTWLYSIAKEEARRYYAADGPAGRGAGTEEAASGLGCTPDFTRHVEDRECVKALIGGLTHAEQKLCILHYYYDMPLKKISEVMEENYNTIRSMHLRGMTKMRRHLKRLTE